MDYNQLGLTAQEAKKTAVPTYSKFHVGAALLTSEGEVYTGGNIETSSYSLTICAERTAVFKAISEGVREFKAIAISSDLEGFCTPCGSCRQVLWDLCGDIDIVLINSSDEIIVHKLSSLLPLAFDGSKLNRE